jgi:hypothetical protein
MKPRYLSISAYLFLQNQRLKSEVWRLRRREAKRRKAETAAINALSDLSQEINQSELPAWHFWPRVVAISTLLRDRRRSALPW